MCAQAYEKKEGQCTYKHNTEVCSCSHCCCAKAIIISHSQCVSVALDIQHAKHMHCTIICGMRGSTIFFHIISQMAWFSAIKLLGIKCVFWFSLHLLPEKLLILQIILRYYHKCTLVFIWSTCYSCQILMKLEFSWQIFEKYSNIKLGENPSSGSWDVPCRKKKDTDMTKLIVTFRNFANVPKNYSSLLEVLIPRVFLFAAPQCETGALCLISHIHWTDNAYEKWVLVNKMCVQYSCKLCIMGKS